ncbi:alpha/beta fold hydrolase [Actinoplanes sp. CA-030573]|uniref:alpha/beta fold hydrolase n=1 Tax=Actinoplanes sp. CA-030573 TaxID=3239898 RepID=UPI003D8E2D50
MREAKVRPDGSRIRWVEIAGAEPARVYLHGLGASSAPYFAAAVADPTLVGRRSLLVDLLGHGISDRPVDAGYTLEDHADWVATALDVAGVRDAEVIGHSMGGAVAIVLAARHPRLVGRLLLVDANLDPYPPGHRGIAARWTEDEFVHGDGRERHLRRVGRHWAATMRLAGPEALYRSALHLGRGTTPSMRELLVGLEIPRAYLHPAGAAPDDVAGLVAAGVEVVAVPDCGHNIMLDNPEAFVAAVRGWK